MRSPTTQVDVARTEIRRAACVLVHRHGTAAPTQADVRYRWLMAQQSSAAPLWREIRDYLAEARYDPARWDALCQSAYPDPVTRLSGSHNGPIHEPSPS